MADNSRDVELRIRARDYSQKTLKDLTAITKGLIEVMEQQVAAAELGEGANKDLTATYDRLADAGKQLLKLDALVKTFQKQSEAVDKAAQSARDARRAQDELQASYGKLDKLTKAQERDITRAATASDRAAKAEEQRRSTLARTGAELQKYGVDLTNLSGAQSSFASSVQQINTALERQQSAIDKLPAAQQAAKLRQAAEQERIAAQQVADREVNKALSQAAEQRAAADKVADGLRLQADQALATAKGYQSLGRVVARTTGEQNALGQQLYQIISPAAAARSTLSGVERQVADLDTEITRAGKNIQDGAQKLRDLAAAQKSLMGMAQAVDAYRQQVTVVREARAAYVAARTDVQALAAQMKAAGTDGAQFAAKLQQAQQTLRASATNLRNATQAARDSKAQLQQAGIATANLTAQQERMARSAQQSAAAAQRLTAAMRDQQKAGSGTASILQMISGNGRQTLDMMQRLRGEVLALATTYVGVQGSINLAGGAIDAYKMRQQALLKISTVVGDSQAAQAEQWDYMVGLANKLGIGIDVIASSYTKFAVAAHAVGIGMQETRYIFESVAKAGRVFALSADDMNGVFKALEQMLSKGQVYAEELRGQLGERLPGAVAMFASGMGMTVQELTKQLELGMVRAEDVINFARENAKAIDAQVDLASASVQAAEARLQTAMVTFRLAIADSGFIEHYTQMLEQLTKFLQSSEGKLAASKIGEAFSHLADAVIWAAENIDTLKAAITALALFKFGQVLVSVALNVGSLIRFVTQLSGAVVAANGTLLAFAGGLTAAGGAAGALGTALMGLLRFIPWVAAAWAAWKVAEWAYESNDAFRMFVDNAGLYVKGFGNLVATFLGSFFTGIDDLIRLSYRKIQEYGAEMVKAVANHIADAVSLIPKVGDEMAASVREFAAAVEGPEGEFVSKTKKMWGDMADYWKRMQEEMTAKQAEEVAKRHWAESGGAGPISSAARAATGQGSFQFTADPGTGTTPEQRKAAQLKKEIDTLNKQAAKAEKSAREALVRKDLAGRLKLIDDEFAPLYKRAQELGGKATTDAITQLDKLKAKRVEIEKLEFQQATSGTAATDKRARAIETLTAEYERLAAAVGQQEAKIDPTASFASRLEADLKKVNVQYDQLILKAQKIGGKEGGNLETQINALREQNLAMTEQKAKQDELKRLQDQLNAQLEIKRANLEEINSLREAGVISEDEQVRRTVELYQQQNGEIEKAINNLEQFAMTMRSSMSPEEWARVNAQIATMRAGLKDVAGTYTQMDKMVVQGTLDGMSRALDSVGDNLEQVISGTMSIGDAFKNLGQVVRQFFADFLMQIAQAIMQQAILNALASSGWGGISGAAVSAGGSAGAAVHHSGGIVGSGSANRSREVSTSWFANAPRFHTGGLPGLKSDEVPAILQKGEQVLSKDDPNNILNGGPGAAGGAPASMDVKIVNTIDPSEFVSQGLSTAAGQQAVLNVIRSNKTAIKAITR